MGGISLVGDEILFPICIAANNVLQQATFQKSHDDNGDDQGKHKIIHNDTIVLICFDDIMMVSIEE